MDNLIRSKPHMAVLKRDILPVSPFALLSEAFTDEIRERWETDKGFFPMYDLAHLENEAEEEVPQQTPGKIHLEVQLKLVLQQLRAQKENTTERRILERANDLRLTREKTRVRREPARFEYKPRSAAQQQRVRSESIVASPQPIFGQKNPTLALYTQQAPLSKQATQNGRSIAHPADRSLFNQTLRTNDFVEPRSADRQHNIEKHVTAQESGSQPMIRETIGTAKTPASPTLTAQALAGQPPMMLEHLQQEDTASSNESHENRAPLHARDVEQLVSGPAMKALAKNIAEAESAASVSENKVQNRLKANVASNVESTDSSEEKTRLLSHSGQPNDKAVSSIHSDAVFVTKPEAAFESDSILTKRVRDMTVAKQIASVPLDPALESLSSHEPLGTSGTAVSPAQVVQAMAAQPPMTLEHLQQEDDTASERSPMSPGLTSSHAVEQILTGSAVKALAKDIAEAAAAPSKTQPEPQKPFVLEPTALRHVQSISSTASRSNAESPQNEQGMTVTKQIASVLPENSLETIVSFEPLRKLGVPASQTEIAQAMAAQPPITLEHLQEKTMDSTASGINHAATNKQAVEQILTGPAIKALAQDVADAVATPLESRAKTEAHGLPVRDTSSEFSMETDASVVSEAETKPAKNGNTMTVAKQIASVSPSDLLESLSSQEFMSTGIQTMSAVQAAQAMAAQPPVMLEHLQEDPAESNTPTVNHTAANVQTVEQILTGPALRALAKDVAKASVISAESQSASEAQQRSARNKISERNAKEDALINAKPCVKPEKDKNRMTVAKQIASVSPENILEPVVSLESLSTVGIPSSQTDLAQAMAAQPPILLEHLQEERMESGVPVSDSAPLNTKTVEQILTGSAIKELAKGIANTAATHSEASARSKADVPGKPTAESVRLPRSSSTSKIDSVVSSERHSPMGKKPQGITVPRQIASVLSENLSDNTSSRKSIGTVNPVSSAQSIQSMAAQPPLALEHLQEESSDLPVSMTHSGGSEAQETELVLTGSAVRELTKNIAKATVEAVSEPGNRPGRSVLGANAAMHTTAITHAASMSSVKPSAPSMAVLGSTPGVQTAEQAGLAQSITVQPPVELAHMIPDLEAPADGSALNITGAKSPLEDLLKKEIGRSVNAQRSNGANAPAAASLHAQCSSGSKSMTRIRPMKGFALNSVQDVASWKDTANAYPAISMEYGGSITAMVQELRRKTDREIGVRAAQAKEMGTRTAAAKAMEEKADNGFLQSMDLILQPKTPQPQTVWQNPYMRGGPSEMAHYNKNNPQKGKGQGQPRQQTPPRMSDAEIRRTADKVFKLVQEKILAERRRTGRV